SSLSTYTRCTETGPFGLSIGDRSNLDQVVRYGPNRQRKGDKQVQRHFCRSGIFFMGLCRALLTLALSANLQTSGFGDDKSPARLASPAGLSEDKDPEPEAFTYRQIGDRVLKAYVFFPSSMEKSRPAILMFHGGAWTLGEASWMFGRA